LFIFLVEESLNNNKKINVFSVGSGTVMTSGQNVYISLSTTPPSSAMWNVAVDAWYGEVAKWSASNINSYP
jgi:hypothetical protein